VFHLGNFAWDPITCENVLKKLNGVIVFLRGNADEILFEQDVLISQESILSLKHFDVVLCHYPMKNWPGKETGTIHFHGHELYNNETTLVKGCNVVNVCTDFWDFKPVKFSAIKNIIDYKS
jgi:calcineurin-like phosphoesterase family protein